MIIKSPVTGGPVVLEKTLDVSEIVTLYQREFNFNVREIFGQDTSISVYRCVASGYRFFYPLHASGTQQFYEHFGRYEWYYSPWRWEHEKALSFIKEGDRVLEVGSGEGAFIQRASQEKKITCVGLELNKAAVLKGKACGLDLRDETIQKHAESNKGVYDVVCAYQVLEHIGEVGDVIQAMIRCLKPGGLLLIAVPNNDSFLKSNPLPSRILNMPPHHMGLWNKTSLENLVQFFPLVHQQTLFEPLQDLHRDTFLYARITQLFFNINLFTRIFWKLRLHVPLRHVANRLRKNIIGHTVMVVYKSRS